MSVLELLFDRFRTIGWPGRLLVATGVAAALNFGEIFFRTLTTHGSFTIDGYTLHVCRFGPPPSFYPRFLIACSLLMASVGVLRWSLPRRLVVVSLFAALTVYAYWWMESYQLFKNLADEDITFINRIHHTAYLYGATGPDAAIAASVVICSVALLDRMLSTAHGKRSEETTD